MKLFIDVGGTYLRSELHGPADILRQKVSSQEHELIAFIESKLAEHLIISFIGISFAGQVYKGEILSSPNLHISQPKIKEYFESRYTLRLEIDNDLNCAVMAEAEYFKSDSVLALYIGTGIRSALIDEGRLVRGTHNQAFEIGHIPYKESPFTCGCGKTNCLELFASGSGLNKWMEYFHMHDLPLNELEKFQDKKSTDVTSNFKEALLFCTATLITLSNPKIIVFGGGVMKRNAYLLEWLKENLPGYAFANALDDVRMLATSLNNGSMEGAKLLEENFYA